MGAALLGLSLLLRVQARNLKPQWGPTLGDQRGVGHLPPGWESVAQVGALGNYRHGGTAGWGSSAGLRVPG